MASILNLQQFRKTTDKVIANLEGGYFHPRMLPSFNSRSQAIMKNSGETLFGLDRKAGVQLSKYPEWKQFWQLVDLHSKSWKYNQKPGGQVGEILREFAAEIMFKWFGELSDKYLDDDCISAMLADDRLMIHIVYAAWNGEGWFRKFANALNTAIITGRDKEEIFQIAFAARQNASSKAIRQQAVNMVAAW